MENRIILKANLKRHKVGLTGIGLLTFLAAALLGTVLTVWLNSREYIGNELWRVGYGDITAWVSGVPNLEELSADIASLEEVSRVEPQKIIFSSYEINGQESDSEGQLLLFSPDEKRYRFFKDDFSGYLSNTPQIAPGEVYVSPSLRSMFDIKRGDTVRFPVARSGRNMDFTIKGFYEDPVMGSSMIGMKGFLICESDRNTILSVLQDTGIDALARDGAMLHIFANGEIRTADLNSAVNEKTALPQYTEFVHSKDAISGFMLVLHQAFCGFLTAFAIVLLAAVLAILSHSITSSIEADTKNMGILKTVGISSSQLRKLQAFQYALPVSLGLLCGLAAASPLSGLINHATISTIGVRIPAQLPLFWCALCDAAILFLLTGFAFLRTRKIGRIPPVSAITQYAGNNGFQPKTTVPIIGKALYLRLAFRQVSAGKRHYLGAMLVAALLVFSVSLAGRMNAWLGPNGKGMMDAFNPADHDIGVQVFGNLTSEEAENAVRSYSEIADTYALAMPGVSVNGVDYTANVISEPERFHILSGKTCSGDNEIVLTEFVAEHFAVSVGDTVTVQGDMGQEEYVVSGIYSCANDMGDNVGMSREGYLKIGRDDPHIWCWHYFLKDPSQKAAITSSLEAAYGGDVHVHENTWPGLFGIISAMRTLLAVLYGISMLFVLIVTTMTGQKLLTAEQRDLGIYKALGFQTGTLRWTFALRFSITAVLGSTIGTILAALAADPLISAVMKLAGISNFSSQPGLFAVLLPSIAVILMFLVFAYLTGGKIKEIDVSLLIAE